MRNLLKTTALLGFLVLGASSVAGAQVSFGIRIGPPPPPRVIRVHPGRPGPEFVWVNGYWAPVGNHYRWHDGHWVRPPYRGARWIAPRYDGREFFNGRWDGDRGRRVRYRYRDRDFRLYRR